MKKIIISLIVFLCLCSFNGIYAAGTYFFNGDSIVDNTVSLDNFNSISVSYDDDYVLYTTDDLTIDLTGTNSFGDYGMYVRGNLTIVGSGSLSLTKLTVMGDVFTSDVTLYVTDGYNGPKLYRPISVVDDEGNNLMYDGGEGYYCDYLTKEEATNIIIKPTRDYVDFDNLTDLDNVYEDMLDVEDPYTREVINNDGFVEHSEDELDSISYNPNTLTYTVKYVDNEDTTYIDEETSEEYYRHFINFVFNSNELGKDIAYKVLDSSNVYKINDDVFEGDLSVYELEKDETYYETEGYVGERDMFKETEVSEETLGAGFFSFLCKGDYCLKLEAIGNDGSHRFININIEEEIIEDDDTDDNDPIIKYIVPNTGIRY